LLNYNHLKYALYFGLTAFIILALQPSFALDAPYLANISYNNNISYVQVPNLIVNTHETQRTIVRKNEKKGIEDIRKLLKHATLEEKWIYVPEKKLWVEMGIHSTRIEEDGRLGYLIFSKMRELKEIFLTEDKLIDYHFHPENIYHADHQAKNLLKEMNLVENDKNLAWAKDNYLCPVQNIFSAIPVRDDLFHLIVSSCIFYQIHPDGDYCHKFLSTYGITTCSIKNGKKNSIRNYTIKDAETMTDLLSSQIDTYIDHKLSLKHNNIKEPGTGIKIIRQTIRRINHLDLVELEFTPHKEYRSL
jgi:hypothetical protein